jgi:hypothetical protein
MKKAIQVAQLASLPEESDKQRIIGAQENLTPVQICYLKNTWRGGLAPSFCTNTVGRLFFEKFLLPLG